MQVSIFTLGGTAGDRLFSSNDRDFLLVQEQSIPFVNKSIFPQGVSQSDCLFIRIVQFRIVVGPIFLQHPSYYLRNSS